MSEDIGIEYVPWSYYWSKHSGWTVTTTTGWWVADVVDEDVARHIVECHNEDLKTQIGAYPND